jgi:hypothetical protein
MFPVIDRYDEVFQIEIDGWCFGITNFPGEISPSMIHHILRELSIGFHAAIEHNVVFNVVEVAGKFSKAARYLIHEKEIAFAIMAQLPNPNMLDEERQCVLGMVIDTVEQVYPGALETFYQRWRVGSRRNAA